MNTAKYVLEPLCVTLIHRALDDQLSSAVKGSESALHLLGKFRKELGPWAYLNTNKLKHYLHKYCF